MVDFWFVDVSRSEIAMLIDEWIHSERDRAICRRRFLDGVKFEALAEEFDLSVRQTKNIIYRSRRCIIDNAHLPRTF